MRDAAFTWRPRQLSCRFKKMTYFRTFCCLNSSCIRKSITLKFMSFSKDNSHFCSKTRQQMLLLVSVRHVGAHQHGFSIQGSISLGKTFLRISCIRNIPLTWILARVFVYVPPFIFQILDFIRLSNGFDFYFDLFWMAWHWKPAIDA